MRSRYAGQPFDTSDTDIAAALEQVSIPTLLLSLVHITGDPRFVRDFKPAGIFLNEVQGFMSEEDKARARARSTSGDRRLSRPRLPRACSTAAGAHPGDDGLGGLRERS